MCCSCGAVNFTITGERFVAFLKKKRKAQNQNSKKVRQVEIRLLTVFVGLCKLHLVKIVGRPS